MFKINLAACIQEQITFEQYSSFLICQLTDEASFTTTNSSWQIVALNQTKPLLPDLNRLWNIFYSHGKAESPFYKPKKS